jgi:hypothetical protein
MHLLARLAALLTLSLILAAGTVDTPASAAVPDAVVTAATDGTPATVVTTVPGQVGRILFDVVDGQRIYIACSLQIPDSRIATALYGRPGPSWPARGATPRASPSTTPVSSPPPGPTRSWSTPSTTGLGPSRPGSSPSRPTRPSPSPTASRSGWRRPRPGRRPPSPSPASRDGRSGSRSASGPTRSGDVSGPPCHLHGHPGRGSRSPPALLTVAGGWGAPPGRRVRPAGGRWQG